MTLNTVRLKSSISPKRPTDLSDLRNGVCKAYVNAVKAETKHNEEPKSQFSTRQQGATLYILLRSYLKCNIKNFAKKFLVFS